jgi:hypothetical protein
MRDRLNLLNLKPVLNPGVVGPVNNTPVVGAIIDRYGFDSLTYAIQTGAMTTGGATYKITMEEGNDPALADTSAVAAGDLLGDLTPSFAGAAQNSAFKIGYIGAKRYTRITITPTGNAAATNFSAVAILESPQLSPTVNPPA